MSIPFADPSAVCMQLEPGDTRAAVIHLSKIPSAATVTLTLAGAGSLVRVTEMVVSRVFERRLTEEEIQELPPFPPSIRENARRNGRVEEHEEVARSSGSGPIAAGPGQVLDIGLEFTAPPQTPEGVTAAQLVIHGTTWTTLELPLFTVVGRAVATPVVEPDKLRVALAPGETTTRTVLIASAPTGDALIACMINGRDLIRLKQIIAFRMVHKAFTEEEIAELPPFPTSIREIARREGYDAPEEAARSDGTIPLSVAPGQMVQAYLEFTAPAAGFPNITEAALVIDSPRWQRTEVPVRLTIGDIGVELTPDTLTVSQGKTVDFVVTVIAQSGPGDDVHFNIDGGDEKLQVVPNQMRMLPGQRNIGQLTLFVDADAPIGARTAMFEVRVFEQLQVHRVPLQLTVQAGGIVVSSRPFAVTAMQGDTVAFDITVFSDGGMKLMTFEPGDLPRGVRMEPARLSIGPAGGVFVQPMRFVIDSRARTTDRAWAPIRWSANDGAHAGILNVPLTITLRPDARTFRQEITTPPGTALGGFAELTIRSDGSFTFRGHMHGSGLDPYNFRIGYFLRIPSGELTLADVFSSRVGGTLGGGPRDRDWDITAQNELLRVLWPDIGPATPEFTKWYEDSGVLATLEDTVTFAAEFLLVRALAGPAVAAVLVLGPELAQVTHLPLTAPRAIPGSIILNGVVFLFGPLAAIPTVVAGIAIAAADDVQSRPMHASEIADARRVFGDTLPVDRIRVTNLLKRGGLDKAFCELNTIDQTILLGVGEQFHTEILDDATFMHELTHAWQIAHRAFSPADLWGAIERPFLSPEEEAELYRIYFDGRPWRDFHSEGQAKAVETWYESHRHDLDGDAARNDLLFRYIANNIRTGLP
jgi:hypothetical protein